MNPRWFSIVVFKFVSSAFDPPAKYADVPRPRRTRHTPSPKIFWRKWMARRKHNSVINTVRIGAKPLWLLEAGNIDNQSAQFPWYKIIFVLLWPMITDGGRFQTTLSLHYGANIPRGEFERTVSPSNWLFSSQGPLGWISVANPRDSQPAVMLAHLLMKAAPWGSSLACMYQAEDTSVPSWFKSR